METTILKVLIGSRGYGIFNEESDHDYCSVYITPTRELLSLGGKVKGTHWNEGDDVDNTAYELGHFLFLAQKCNPTVLAVFKAPIVHANNLDFALQLRALFPVILDIEQCYITFVGYGMNQRKKMIDNKDDRWIKYGTAYVRHLYYLEELVYTGNYDYIIRDKDKIFILRQIRKGEWSMGRILDYCQTIKANIDFGMQIMKKTGSPVFKPSPDVVNEFLLEARKKYWE